MAKNNRKIFIPDSLGKPAPKVIINDCSQPDGSVQKILSVDWGYKDAAVRPIEITDPAQHSAAIKFLLDQINYAHDRIRSLDDLQESPEWYAGVDQALDMLDTENCRRKARQGVHDQAISELQGAVGRVVDHVNREIGVAQDVPLHERLKNLDEWIDGLGLSIATVTQKVEESEKRLGFLDKKPLSSLEKHARIRCLEDQVAKLESNVGDNGTDWLAFNKRIAAVEELVAEQKSANTVFMNRLNSLQLKIFTNQGTATTRHLDVKNQLTALAEKVDGLESKDAQREALAKILLKNKPLLVDILHNGESALRGIYDRLDKLEEPTPQAVAEVSSAKTYRIPVSKEDLKDAGFGEPTRSELHRSCDPICPCQIQQPAPSSPRTATGFFAKDGK